jgi:hypothetical protein
MRKENVCIAMGREHSDKRDADQRSSVRFPVHAPVIYRWSDQSGQQRGMGFSRDMCRSGMYVVCDGDSVVPVGMRLEVYALLPSLGEHQVDGIRLQAEGSVVRAGEAGEPVGFAIAADFGY